jgi:hypothetical protein
MLSIGALAKGGFDEFIHGSGAFGWFGSEEDILAVVRRSRLQQNI